MNLRELLEELRRMKDQSLGRHAMAWLLVVVHLLVKPFTGVALLYVALQHGAALSVVRAIAPLLLAITNAR